MPSRMLHGLLHCRRLLLAASLAVSLATILLPTPANAQCGPAAGGATTCGDGPATQGNQSGTSQGAGNPVNVITGNKYQREDDLPALPGVLGLEIVRHYNSAYSNAGNSAGILGHGWKLSYETDLYAIGNTIQIMQADGTRVIFNRDPDNRSLCSTANPANGSLRITHGSRGDIYTWIWTSGRTLRFDSNGKLEQIAVPTGEFLSLQHDARGMLVQVIDPQGRQLLLQYPRPQDTNAGFRGVASIISPAGTFRYAYGGTLPKGATATGADVLANLIRVNYPADGGSRTYHHEDAQRPTYLTGISVTDIKTTQRISTYGYNRDGKAVLSVRGPDNTSIGKVVLDFSTSGITVLTNSLGQKTTYRHAIIGGEQRLLEVRGAGCHQCGEMNVRYGYDPLGRLIETTRLTTEGIPIEAIRLDVDYYGRPLAVSKIVYQDGRARPARQQARYVYSSGTAATPSLIAQPSVVPGKEFITRVTYDASNQPLEITQRGWAPANGDKASPTQLSRTSKYVYQRVNGRTLLAAVDGPLPNGASNQPVDSDVTLLRWDAKGNLLVGLTTPGNFTSAFTYDAAGRMANVSNAQGRITEFTYDARNRTVGIMRDGITQSTRYDALDNPVETGYLEAGSYKALGLSGYDAAGRQVWNATPLGILQTRIFDTENKVLVSSTQAGSMQKRQRYQYDDAGRLVALTDGSGSTQRISWNTRNLPEQVTDALGRDQRYRYDGAGNLLEIVSAANVAQPRGQSSAIAFEHDDQGRVIAVTAPNGATTRTLRDDFGNILAISSADSGKITRTYDIGGRLVTSMDANGNHAVYEYDVAGRIVKQTVFDITTPDTGTKQTVTSWKYNGKHLVAIDHPHQTEQFQYDARDQRVAKTVSIVLANGGRATSTTRYQYDVHGQLTATTLPDGSTLIYRRNSQNQIVALERSRTRTSWLRWLLPARTLVAKIERDLIGLRHYIYGNGIEARYERSREGVLARIVYRRTAEIVPSGQKVTGLAVLMGITTAHAGQPEDSPPAQATPASGAPLRLPGALGLPVDKQALVDHRYLWDVQGNLIHAQGQDRKTNYAYDAQDRLIVTGSTTTATDATKPGNTSDARYARYFYDGTGNRLLSQEDISSQADTSTNTVKATYGPASSRWQGSTAGSPEIGYDPAGQPSRIGTSTYTWNAMGQLGAIRQNQRLLATYTYDHRGERIAKSVDGKHTYYLYENRHVTAELDDHGRITRQYIYLGDQPIAVIDTPYGAPIESEERAPLMQIGADLAAVLRDWLYGNETVAYLHNNHLGATELATDQQGVPIWRARYSAFGNIMPDTTIGQAGPGTTKKGFVLNLRLPGQYEDAESGLYFNDHRYYDPKRGAYLTPDPLGLRGGINSYAYVKGNPLKYVDPSGLVLFAFDGTENTDDENWLALHNSTVSNVVQFRNIYANDKIHYITGVGTVDKSNPLRPIAAPLLDSGANWSGPARIDRMMEYFNTESDLAVDSATMEVDIIGFSRGAAEARDFSNRIVSGTTMIAGTNTGWYRYTEPKNGINVAKCQKVDFRFMGLWDTVLSTNSTGYVYQLAIPAQFFQVSQAVALNEYRGHVLPFGRANVTDLNSFGAFPLESINTHAGAPTDSTRVEQGFIGSHADIGGGFPNNDLSQVALAWMVEQATKAGIQVTKDVFTVSANPVLHDKSDAIRFGSPIAGSQTSNDAAWNSLYDIPVTAGAVSGPEDRDVHYGNGSNTTQRQMTGTNMTNSDTEQFITYDPARSRGDNITGTINMDGYRAWLLRNGYDLSKLTVQ